MKNKYEFLILGSGIGGTSLAADIKSKIGDDFLVIEKKGDFIKNLQNGLHYLHSVDFYLPFSFEFKKVHLTEEIWDTKNNIFKKSATLPEMFEYSRKLMHNLRHPSSIMDPGKNLQVWLPESNNMDDLLDSYYDYIGKEHFLFNSLVKNVFVDDKKVLIETDGKEIEIEYGSLITTMPMDVFCKCSNLDFEFDLKFKELYITNYKADNIVPNWLIVFYMFDNKIPVYRITVLNNIISMESMHELTYEEEVVIKYLIGDVLDYDLKSVNKFKWESGRIFGINKEQRGYYVKELFEKNIYSIGRYGLWNGKIRMDDTIRQADLVVDYFNDNNKKNELFINLIG